MAIEYTNRKGKTFVLHEGKTKKGNPKYHFSQKNTGNLVDSIPEGYEIYENPNAQVFLRKIPPQIISDAEKELVKNGIETYSGVKYFIIDIKKETIYIHTSNEQIDDLTETLGPFGRYAISDTLKQRMLHYMPVLLFKLVDKEKRLFITQRFCFRGSIDDWIEISGPDTLENHVKRFVKHLGEESFYELI